MTGVQTCALPIFVAYSSEDWPTLNEALILRGVKEGIKDYRYIAMLERLAEAKKETAAGRAALA